MIKAATAFLGSKKRISNWNQVSAFVRLCSGVNATPFSRLKHPNTCVKENCHGYGDLSTGGAEHRWHGHMLSDVVLISFTDAMAKWLAADYPVHQPVSFRTVLDLLPCLLFVARSGGLTTLYTRRPMVHLRRAWPASIA